MPEDFLGLFRSESDGIILQPGQELFRKGDVGYHMYAVKSGELQVIDGNHVFETVSSGGIVGEMALISNDTRTATVRAIRKSVVVPVDEIPLIVVRCEASQVNDVQETPHVSPNFAKQFEVVLQTCRVYFK